MCVISIPLLTRCQTTRRPHKAGHIQACTLLRQGAHQKNKARPPPSSVDHEEDQQDEEDNQANNETELPSVTGLEQTPNSLHDKVQLLRLLVNVLVELLEHLLLILQLCVDYDCGLIQPLGALRQQGQILILLRYKLCLLLALPLQELFVVFSHPTLPLVADPSIVLAIRCSQSLPPVGLDFAKRLSSCHTLLNVLDYRTASLHKVFSACNFRVIKVELAAIVLNHPDGLRYILQVVVQMSELCGDF
mmetsp:Transcript_73119/g.169563  ORF Transcript_73119/g.169563 Transcript_73119/m.169563 type:complete len:247 (+) Transcript_73119:226-966(+)